MADYGRALAAPPALPDELHLEAAAIAVRYARLTEILREYLAAQREEGGINFLEAVVVACEIGIPEYFRISSTKLVLLLAHLAREDA